LGFLPFFYFLGGERERRRKENGAKNEKKMPLNRKIVVLIHEGAEV